MNECVICGAQLPTESNSMVCAQCRKSADGFSAHSVGHLDAPLKPNTELSFGASDGNYDFLVNYRRAKPLTKLQIWMYKVCFGIRAKNI